MNNTYHFAVPKVFVWVQHIILGCLYFYIGYCGLQGKISKNASLFLIISGVIAFLYHGHIWLTHSNYKHKH